jgi:signal transduction histidine kinase
VAVARKVSSVHRPSPDQYNPPLTWQAHAWRTALALLMSGVLGWSSAPLQWHAARWLFWLDLSLGIVALALSFFRRRWPLTIAVITSLMGAVSVTANGPGTLVKVSLATRRVVWQIVLVGLLDLASSASIPMLQPAAAAEPWGIDFVLGLLSAIAMLVCGMYIGSRRELLWTLRDRAERAEAEQGLRVEQGRLNERTRIAREMHDALAHRISLIAMHAGALAYRTDLTADEIRQTAELIQGKSHQALSDLRQVLGVLRDSDASGVSERPQPTFADLSALVLEAEGAGMRIQYDDRVLATAEMPDRVGRTAYRIVQEGLTNVRKHAPGVTVLVQVSGSPAEGVNIRIRNPARSPHAFNDVPGAGLGLVGLSERAKLAGGQLTTRRDGGSFELAGWLPWTT